MSENESFELFESMGEPLPPLIIGPPLADSIRSMAIIEGVHPTEVLLRALSYYDGHLNAVHEGYEGPIYKRQVKPKGRFAKMSKFLLKSDVETLTFSLEIEE